MMPHPEVQVGDTVIVVSLPDFMERGLPADEQAFISKMVGHSAVIDEIAGNQFIVRVTDPSNGTIHFFELSGEHISRGWND